MDRQDYVSTRSLTPEHGFDQEVSGEALDDVLGQEATIHLAPHGLAVLDTQAAPDRLGGLNLIR